MRVELNLYAHGAWALQQGTVALPLEACVLFSSVTALLGGAGHSGAIWGAWVVHGSPLAIRGLLHAPGSNLVVKLRTSRGNNGCNVLDAFEFRFFSFINGTGGWARAAVGACLTPPPFLQPPRRQVLVYL